MEGFVLISLGALVVLWRSWTGADRLVRKTWRRVGRWIVGG